ncbi:MAG TPA: hypothetical protein DCG19_11455 [Cryomorphaceae bacterium]|nr:hypothetical protein [Owenweeksia sp.]MBG00621.1 hypothetical protein [Owenweeksia sp.]HAD98014.1 hypothetical protein [Cryomorphaceae bacterium]
MLKPIIISLILLVAGCAPAVEHTKDDVEARREGQKEAVNPTSTGVLPTDTLERHALATFDTNGPYAWYQPACIQVNAQTRAILFFDPHGDGAHPLRLYRHLADEFGMVLMGSNESENGMSMEQILPHVREMLLAAEKAGIRKEQVTFCGFSGGAKVALYTANSIPGITKVIYCGASLNIPLRSDLALLGFAGRLDMNYTDMVQFEWYLQSQPQEHYLVEWEGDHRFPDAEVFRDGFRFATAKPLNLAGKEITITPNEVREEQQKKQYLYNALLQEDLGWWQQTVQKMKASPTPMDQRLLGFISLACYSLGNRAAQQRNTALLEKIIPVYRAVDLESEGPGELVAKLEGLKM